MRNFRNVLIATLLALVSNSFVLAQSGESTIKLLLVREDKVIPSMASNYEAALADLKSILESVNDLKINYFCHMQDDFYFTHMIPVNSLEDIENLKFDRVVERLGKPELTLVYDELCNSIESSKYYLIKYHADLSYIPQSENWLEKSQYRKWTFYYLYPGTQDEVMKILSAWKGLYNTKEVLSGYRVFEGFLGIEQPVIILTNWAENPTNHQEKLTGAMEKLGNDGAALWTATMQYVREVKIIEGWFLPQYSYTRGLKLAE